MSERVAKHPGVKEYFAAQITDPAHSSMSPLRAAVEVMRWTVYPHECFQRV